MSGNRERPTALTEEDFIGMDLATEAKQDDEIAALNNIEAYTNNSAAYLDALNNKIGTNSSLGKVIIEAPLGQTVMDSSIPVVLPSNQSAIPVTVTPAAPTSLTEAFGGTGAGTTIDVHTISVRMFAIVVTSDNPGGATWNVDLEGSLDNVNFSPLFAHTNTDGEGVLVSSGAMFFPVAYFRANVTAMAAASTLNVSLLGFT